MDRALILTTSSIFDRAVESPPAGPLTMVGGLSLFQRTVLTLQRAGISRFMILGGDQIELLEHQLHGDSRLTAEVRWLPVREFPVSDPRTWEILSGMLGGSYLVTGCTAIFPVSLIARLREEALKGETIVVTRSEVYMPQAMLRQPRSLALPLERGVEGAVSLSSGGTSVVTLEAGGSASLNLGLAWMTEHFTSVGWATAHDHPYPLQAALERGIRQGQVKVLPLGDDWYQEVRRGGSGTVDAHESVAQAERTLLRSLKGGLEGFVDRYFNRKCSPWLTQWLLRTPLTPNAITMLATLVGLLAAVAFAHGGYAAGVLGAVLFQLSAILDCCDGEVARLKFLESPFGEQLDVVLDNVVHIAIFAGMAWASYHTDGGRWALLLGGLAIFGNIAAFGVVQRAMRMRGRLDHVRRALVDGILNRLASRDFSVVILALALIGHLDWFLLLAAVGSNIFWPVLAWQLRVPAPSR
jgi:phosphatidylglycerophosphate synthase